MQIIWQPKIALISFFLIFFVVYLFYLTGEKKYQKRTLQTVSYFSGQIPPKNIKLEGIFWGFFKDLEKLYGFLLKIQKENANDYIFFLVFGLIIFLLLLSF